MFRYIKFFAQNEKGWIEKLKVILEILSDLFIVYL